MNLSDQFNLLADKWERETRNISSPNQIEKHPAIKAIEALGQDVVPLILQRMKHQPGFWFGTLATLTHAQPIEPSMQGDMQQMTDAWIKWGHENKIII